MSTLRDKSPFNDKVRDPSQGVMMALRTAASSGDETALLEVLVSADWDLRDPDQYMEAIRLALAVSAHQTARRLTTVGAQRYPDHDDLRNSALVLAPPKTGVSGSEPTSGAKANRDWLRDNSRDYRGSWVALRCGALLAVANTLADLTAMVGSTDGVLLTRA